jgi:TnpA family transposase
VHESTAVAWCTASMQGRRCCTSPLTMRVLTVHIKSEPVFGLAYLLAIQLMPRIRNWKDLTFYAPSERFALEHIVHLREFFTETIH